MRDFLGVLAQRLINSNLQLTRETFKAKLDEYYEVSVNLYTYLVELAKVTQKRYEEIDMYIEQVVRLAEQAYNDRGD